MSWIWIGILIGIGLILAPLVLLVILWVAKVFLDVSIEISRALWKLTTFASWMVAGAGVGWLIDYLRGSAVYSVTILGAMVGLGVAIYLSDRNVVQRD